MVVLQAWGSIHFTVYIFMVTWTGDCKGVIVAIFLSLILAATKVLQLALLNQLVYCNHQFTCQSSSLLQNIWFIFMKTLMVVCRFRISYQSQIVPTLQCCRSSRVISKWWWRPVVCREPVNSWCPSWGLG